MGAPNDETPRSQPSVAAGKASDNADLPPRSAERPGAAPAPGEGRLARLIFHFLWVFAVPFALAIAGVWLLTPAPGATDAGGLRLFVGEQQVPAGIVLFTAFAMLLWRFRYELPLAAAIGVGGRRDVPLRMRQRFEEAGALLDEARRIEKSVRRAIERVLTPDERAEVEEALQSLDRAMARLPFDPAMFEGAYARADRAVGEHYGRWRKGEVREYAESIGIAVAVALVLRAFVVEAFKIPSGSMIPTLMIGDHIFVNKFSYGPLIPWSDTRLFDRAPPARGDVMVFKFPENREQDFIKRVIALPGDRLEVLDGRPVINGWLAPHCRIGAYTTEGHATQMYMEFLGENAYLTLFDDASDERACTTSEECGAGLACRGNVCGALQGPYDVAKGEAWVLGDNRNNSHDSRSWRGGLGGGVPFELIKGRAMFVWMSFGPGGGVAQDRLFVDVMGKPRLTGSADPALLSGIERCLRDRPALAKTTPPGPAARP